MLITLSPGTYGPAETRRPGPPGVRIVLQINHSHYRVEGLTVDGQPGIPRSEFPSNLGAARAFKDRVPNAAAAGKAFARASKPSPS